LGARREGRKIRRPNHGCRICLACDGRGDRPRRRGEASWEAYSGLPMSEVGSGVSGPQIGSQRLNTLLRIADPGMEGEYGWLRERQRYFEAGSYAELDKALDWLRDHHHPRYEMVVHWAQTQGEQWWSWSERAERAVAETLIMLADRMDDPIRVPAWVVRRYRGVRKAA